MPRKVGGRKDRKIFKVTASRTRKENIPSRILPRGGVRH